MVKLSMIEGRTLKEEKAVAYAVYTAMVKSQCLEI